MASSKTFTLRSSDSETFKVDEDVAMQSQTIKSMIEDGCAENEIPFPNVTGRILAKVIKYCLKHVETPEAEAWDADIVKVDNATVFDLALGFHKHSFTIPPYLLGIACIALIAGGSVYLRAAHYLEIPSLLDLTTRTIADRIIFENLLNLTCQTVGDRIIIKKNAANYPDMKSRLDYIIKSKWIDIIDSRFAVAGIINPEEEEVEFRRENQWAFK